MSRYGIKEVFGTLQGEGAQAGSPAVFLRFAGCNLGYDVCPWCDTDWKKAEMNLTCDEAVAHIERVAMDTFGRSGDGLLIVVTGGEPSLQFDLTLSRSLRTRGFRIAMESNGSRLIDRDLIDWLTISPKQEDFVQLDGDELKVVFTGEAALGIAPSPAAVRQIAAGTSFSHYFLQPVDLPEAGGPNFSETVNAVTELGPPWRLSVQTHKVVGLK